MPTFVRRAMVYLGLVDDEYDDYEPYEEPEAAAPPPRPPVRLAPSEAQSEPAQSGVRTLARDEQASGVGSVTPRSAVVRPLSPDRSARVHITAPVDFADAQEIGDRLKASQPVIVNLQGAELALGRRMIDFCSGVTYALGGTMEKVAEQVFLLTPSNVEVSAEERQRLQERGLYRS
jgi:cell division inhibitor SepF